GAAGQIGMGAVVRAEPDGYTLLTLPNEIRSVIPLLYKLPYDVEQSLVPVASLARVPMIMTVHPSVPANTVQEFIAYAKANPDKIAYGSAGDGTLHHLSGELFKMKANVDMMHVPYKGTAPAVNDLLSGRVQVVFSPISAVLQHIKAGKLRALGVASSKPVVALPGLKTLDESGLPNYASDLWVTLFAPAGTPQPVLDKWIAQLKKVANLDETRAALAVQGIEPDFDTSESLKQRFVQDTERWREVVKAANIKLN
ncbi:MAG: tripartite tricarboxylate transporter substrate binding protein, partial [Pigmentiphaga sp.]|nr:tripartite tricarboxylate transporter substrate binding protein [Pigmentiphaga sp.]